MENNYDICIVTQGYPIGNSNARIFVKKLVDEWVRTGKRCVVIAPQSITKVLFKGETRRRYKTTIVSGEYEYLLYSPKYISFSNIKLFNLKLSSIADKLFKKSVFRVVKRESFKSKVFYGHFLNPAGLTCINLKKKYGGKAFFVFGEGADTVDACLRRYKKNEWIPYLDGVISVNSKNRNYLINSDYEIDGSKIKVVINAANKEIFHPINRTEARKQLGIPQKPFVICFVGTFDNRKGILRLDEALKSLESVYSVFIGDGNQDPINERILFKGRVDNERIPLFLNASNVFVLPTLNEGCCNSIVEALSCGVPVISSDREFNSDLIESGGILAIDPENISDIKKAILSLYNNKGLRWELSQNALLYMENNTLENRARIIYDYLLNGDKNDN